MGVFSIDAYGFHWIDGSADDPNDLCLHGHAVAQIGDAVLECDCTVSATALRLLKTLTEDHVFRGDDEQMLPCCGHFLMANDDLTEVTYIGGCASGIDWSVLHRDGMIQLVLEDGYTETVDPDMYREAVYRFADKIEACYRACMPKILPEDEFERSGYIAFWNEWSRRRNAQ